VFHNEVFGFISFDAARAAFRFKNRKRFLEPALFLETKCRLRGPRAGRNLFLRKEKIAMPPQLSHLSEPPQSTEARCPLCNEKLGANPDECSHCDWVRGYRHRKLTGNRRDKIAAVLSVVPGAGHWFKGYPVIAVLFLLGTVPAVYVALMVALPTIGWGFILAPAYWACVAGNAYWIDDRKVPAGQT
jgi:hypothetical protein